MGARAAGKPRSGMFIRRGAVAAVSGVGVGGILSNVFTVAWAAGSPGIPSSRAPAIAGDDGASFTDAAAKCGFNAWADNLARGAHASGGGR